MLLSSKAVAFTLAVCIAAATTAFLALVENTPTIALIVAALISFVAAMMLIYLTLEFLVFREIKDIYTAIDKIRNKDFKAVRKNIRTSLNPLKNLNDEIYSFATKKQQEIDELKKLEVYRREFLADVSHELKTPIFAAQGFIHTLIDGAVDDQAVRDKFLEKAAKSLDGLNALVQDLLTVSQMETGAIQMQQDVFDIRQLTSEVFDQLEKKAGRRGIELLFEKKAEKKLMVQADRNRIRQVMINLIENAIKYGNEDGSVHVNLETDHDQVLIDVCDDGPGIPEEHLQRIFERFYRVEKSRSKDKGGTGLGLAIVKHIVEAHHSKIQVKSTPDNGTTFTFRLKKAQIK